MPSLPTFTNTDQASSPFEEGYQSQLRNTLPDKLYLNPLYSIGPSFESAFYNNSLIGNLGNIAAVKGFGAYDVIRGKEPLSVEKAKEIYNLDVQEPTSESVLQYMYGRKKDKDILDNKLSAVEDTWKTTGVNFLSGLAGGVSADAGIMMLTAPLLNKAGSAFLESSNLLKYGAVNKAASFLTSESFAATLSGGALREAAQFAALEGPVSKYSSSLVNEEYGVKDFLYNMAANAGGGAFFGAVGFGFRKLKNSGRNIPEAKGNDGTGLPEATREVTLFTGELNSRLNKAPELVPTKLLESRLNTTVNPEGGSYIFNPLSVDQVKQTTFYNGHKVQDGTLNVDTQVGVKERFGKGVILTDNKNLMNNSTNGGTVVHVDIDPNANLFDTSLPVDKTIQSKIREALSYFLDGDISEADSYLGKSFDDVMKEVRILADIEKTELPIEMVNNIFKEAGYDGYKFNGEMGGESHNGLFLFDPKSMKPKQFDIAKVIRDTGETLRSGVDNYHQRLLDYKTNIDYEPEYDLIRDIKIDDNFESQQVNSALERDITSTEIGESIIVPEDIADIPLEKLNQEQLLAKAKEIVIKGTDLNTGYDKVREAYKALMNCKG